MPKHDPMSAKAIGNRQKSVGLQRLRWYCQMCQKQCRDENGFKCHTMSESHLRQMRVFAENPNSVLDEFSQEFERGYLETLSQLHGTKRVKANKVYQEYIADKHHIHMNATIWTTLTGFCMHLGKESKAIVDETEKGWFIQYIDRDPKVLARQAQAEQRQQFELDEEERRKREISAQVKAAEERRRNEGGDDADAAVDNSLVRDDNDQKIAVALTTSSTVSLGLKKRPIAALGFAQDSDDEDTSAADMAGQSSSSAAAVGAPPLAAPFSTSSRVPSQGARSSATGGVLAMMIQEDEQRKLKQQSTTKTQTLNSEDASKTSSRFAEASKVAPSTHSGDSSNSKHADSSAKAASESSPDSESWLYKNLIVKVVSKHVARGRVYKQKGRVVRLLGKRYDEAEVEVEGERFDLRLEDLETVIPKVGQSVLVLRGRAKGLEAELLAIHEDRYCCDVRVTQRGSELCGQELRGLEYEHVCKYSP